jgi:hypothetical protein
LHLLRHRSHRGLRVGRASIVTFHFPSYAITIAAMLFSRRLMAAFALAAVMLVPAMAQEGSQNAIGEIFASDASVHGAVRLAGSGMQVLSGSSVAAGQATALLHLARGGNIRICPRTNLSISSSPNGRDLMFGMSTGAVEAEYSLAASADAILTPDFRILLAGPGAFHVAIGADMRGNTCVRSLDNNSASVIISELMGDGTYQVKPGEQVVFHNGKLADPDHGFSDCGCVAPPPVKRAATPPPRPVVPPPAMPAAPAETAATPEPAAPNLADLKRGPAPAFSFPPVDLPPPPPDAASLPNTNQVHVQVDAPFFFNANDVQPALLEQVASLTLSTTPELALIPAPPQVVELRPPPPPPQTMVTTRKAPPPKQGKFFGKVRAFFASIFR